MRTLFSVLFSLLVCGLSGCGILDPFVDTRREAGTPYTVGASSPDRPVVCYNSWTSTPAEIEKLAAEECGKTGRSAVFKNLESMSCRLFLPSSAVFECAPMPEGKPAGSPAKTAP